jgi:hypothetical protein
MMGTSPEVRREPNPVLRWSGWGFLLCAGVVAGHVAWTLYASSEPVVMLDVIAAATGGSTSPPSASSHEPIESCRTFGPIHLTPAMNPIRAVLATGYTPVGANRTPFRIALLDDQGRAVWDRHGVVGGSDENANFVSSDTRLVDFRVERPGTWFFEVGFPEGSQDDLREARIELRRDAPPFDPRVTGGFGLAALACLLVSLLSPRSESYPSPLVLSRDDAREDWRDAA